MLMLVKSQKSKVKSRSSLLSLTIRGLLSLSVVVFALSSCNPEAKAVSGMKVQIEINPFVMSSGFIRVAFVPNKEAYYHVGIVPVEEAPDTTKSSSVKGFMSLMLDRAYADYLYWRSDLLYDGVSPVAEFPTHSLQYGQVTRNFTLLEPGKDYMVFAFAVDAQTNKPDGRLFTSYVSTSITSEYEDLYFEYRVRGYWDYIYPLFFSQMGMGEQIVNYVPWVGATADSVDLVTNGYDGPQAYFLDLFGGYQFFHDDSNIHFGIYAHNNNGLGDGSSYTLFEEGHTYYTGLSLMDGYLSKEALVIYKFHWKNEKIQLLFDKDDVLTTKW